jgi:hypothetical protein
MFDMTGMTFGRLTAIKDVGSKNKTRVWQFQCLCGNTVEAKGTEVRFGAKLSCGCLAKDLSSERKRLKLDGKKFTRLLVLKCTGANKSGHVQWLCKCDCGKETIVNGTALVNGKSKSCGCLRSEIARATRLASKTPNPYSSTKEYRSNLRKRLRENPVIAVHERISRVMAWALSRLDIKKGGKTFEILGYTPSELKHHIEMQFTKGMTWDNRREWEIDHIIPISSAKNLDDLIALNQLSNLRPLWKKENNTKKAKILTLL